MNGDQILNLIGKLSVLAERYKADVKAQAHYGCGYYKEQVRETESLIRDLQASFVNQRVLSVQWSEAQARTFDAHSGQVGSGAMALYGNSDHNCPVCGQPLTHRRMSGFSRLWCQQRSQCAEEMRVGVIGLDEADAMHDLRVVSQQRDSI